MLRVLHRTGVIFAGPDHYIPSYEAAGGRETAPSGKSAMSGLFLLRRVDAGYACLRFRLLRRLQNLDQLLCLSDRLET